MNGFLNLNKPFGITSHDAVARVRRLVGRGIKVGHGGTLDPAATGVLPLALGQATRLVEYLAAARKGYRATVRLGITTSTDDAEGAVVAELPVPALDRSTLEQALDAFRGTIQQVPPMYSAIHHGGKRLYDLARAGETVERTPREVTIYRLDLLSAPSAPDDTSSIILDIECSKGTYIRSLARDLGEALGCGGHLAALERTFVGSFSRADALDLAALEADPSRLAALLLPLEVAVADWPTLTLDAAQAVLVRNGRALLLPDQPGELLRVHAPDGSLLALLARSEDGWRPLKVFAATQA